MRKSVCVLFLSVILLIGLAGSAAAMYSASANTTLTLIFGKPPVADTLDPVLDWLNKEVSIATFSKGATSDQFEVAAADGIALVGFTDAPQVFKIGDLVVLQDETSKEILWNVTITTVPDGITGAAAPATITPEPSTLIFLGLGLVGLIGFRRWKHRK